MITWKQIEKLGFKEGIVVRPTKDYNELMSKSWIVAKILLIDKEKKLFYIDSPSSGRMWINWSWCVPVKNREALEPSKLF